MSNALFPTLAGLTWNSTKTPLFNTVIQRSVNFSELRGSYTSTPIYDIVIGFDLLRADVPYSEFQQLFGFICARRGSWDSFLYLDPEDGTAVLQQFGIGDGAQTVFPLSRSFGAYTEDTLNVAVDPEIYVNAVLQTTGYAVSGGVVTFTSPPANDAALTWSGTYYMRCRFQTDNTPLSFTLFMQHLWEAKTINFFGTFGNKL